MSKKIEIIDLSKLYEAYESVRGTNEYYKYNMETYSKITKEKYDLNKGWIKTSRWVFIGHGIPTRKETYLKRVKGNLYIQSVDNDYKCRVTDEVKELLGLE